MLKNNSENDLMNISKIDSLHLLSSFQKLYGGAAISLEWDLTKNE